MKFGHHHLPINNHFSTLISPNTFTYHYIHSFHPTHPLLSTTQHIHLPLHPLITTTYYILFLVYKYIHPPFIKGRHISIQTHPFIVTSIPPYKQTFKHLPTPCAVEKEGKESAWTCLLSNLDRWSV